jgi:radical SAM superfamily enzyme YgiQ (UPF0313 family)
MNILLIYPQLPDTFFGYRSILKFIGKKAISPPLGLLTVAALLPADWPKRLVDENVTRLTEEDLNWADMAFVSAMIVQRHSARETITRCKVADVPVTAGGPLFTLEYDQYDLVDHFILNEAEVSLPAFISDLTRGQAQRVYRADSFADMHTSPVPLWSLADLEKYALMDIQCSRGCPHNCEFCYVTAYFGREHRHKTADQVIAELDTLKSLGWNGEVFFIDDNFTAGPVYLKRELLPAIIAWQKTNGPMPFHIQSCVTLADDTELLDMLVAAGVIQVFVGIETLEETTLVQAGKLQNRNRNVLADIHTIQQAGIMVMGGFVVGFDTDTSGTFRKIIDCIAASDIVLVIISILLAPPGTRLYERLLSENRLTDTALCDGSDGSTNIIPLMDADVLRDGYREILETVYAPRNYYQRITAYLQKYPAPEISAPVTTRAVLGLFSIILYLGILGRERWFFWKCMLRTLITQPARLPMAIMFAVCGYHYRKRSEQYFFREPSRYAQQDVMGTGSNIV